MIFFSKIKNWAPSSSFYNSGYTPDPPVLAKIHFLQYNSKFHQRSPFFKKNPRQLPQISTTFSTVDECCNFLENSNIAPHTKKEFTTIYPHIKLQRRTIKKGK